MALALPAVLPLQPAQAQPAGTPETAAPELTRQYDIPAGPLTAALNRVGLEAGILLSFSTDMTAGLQTQGARGPHTPASALRALLADTGLEAVRQGNGGWLLVRQPAPSPASAPRAAAETMLPLTTVQADAERETATGPVAGYVARRSSTGSKTDTPMREIPQSMTVVTRDAIDARGVSSLAEALEYAPGFTGLTYGHDQRYDQSIARGIGSTTFANYRDGLKSDHSIYAVPRLNTYGAERVEFLRGPASLLFGSNIPGGSVNSITKRPTPEARGEVRVRAGHPDRLGIAADLSGPLTEDGSLLYRLVALDEKYDLRAPQTRKEERYVAPALTWRLNADTQATLLAHVQQDRIDGYAYPYAFSEQLGYPLFAPEKGWDRFHQDQRSMGLLVDHRFSDGLSVHSRTRHSKTRLDYRLTSIDSFITPTRVARNAQYIRDDAKTWQTDNYLEGRWNSGAWAHTTIVGLDLSRLDGNLYRGDGATSAYDLASGSALDGYTTPALAPMSLSKTRQTGLYLQNQAKFKEQFVLVAGVRSDRYRENASGAWAGGPVSHRKLTGRLGGVWLLPDGWSPYASYSTSFEPQSGVGYSGAPFQPTQGRQYEVGMRYEPPSLNAQFTAAVFDIKQQNVLTTDPLHQDFSIQRGEVGSRGLELEAVASLARSVDLTASYSYTDARVIKDTDASIVGRQNGLVARQKVAAWVNWRLSGEARGISLGVGVRHHGKVPNYDSTVWVPATTLFDARLGYRIEHWELALNIRNLFDRKYLVNCSYGDCYPGDRREAVASATYRW